MNISKGEMIEKKMSITETDIVGGGEILILVAYATKENDNLYSFPSPQIFNEELYQRNKKNYDDEVIKFRSEVE